MMTAWTQESIAMLKALAGKGLSAGRIALAIGGVSRCAVSSKAARLGVTLKGNCAPPSRAALSRETNTRKDPLVRTPRQPKARPDPAGVAALDALLDRAPPPAVDGIARPPSLGLTLMELGRHGCRWPEGEGAGITFCGHRAETGRPYCCFHVLMARGAGTRSERRALRGLAVAE